MNAPPEKPPQPRASASAGGADPAYLDARTGAPVFELTDDLRETIWMLYDAKLQALLREQCADLGACGSSDALNEGSF